MRQHDTATPGALHPYSPAQTTNENKTTANTSVEHQFWFTRASATSNKLDSLKLKCFHWKTDSILS